jgi:1-acyl-sn-glycerol-3-phosphate acyltransferase
MAPPNTSFSFNESHSNRETFLTQHSHSNFTQTSNLTPLQTHLDGIVSNFVEKTTDGYALAIIPTAGLAGRGLRMGALELFRPFARIAPATLNTAAQGIAHVAGFAGEAILFDGGQKVARVLGGNTQLATLNLHGKTGLIDGSIHSALTLFGFKMSGMIGANQSALANNILQVGTIMFTHQAAGRLGIEDRSKAGWDEQIAEAESTVLQICAGMKMLHTGAPSIAQYEAAKDLRFEAAKTGLSTRSGKFSEIQGRQLAAEGVGNQGTAIRSSERMDPKKLYSFNAVIDEGATGSSNETAPPTTPKKGSGNTISTTAKSFVKDGTKVLTRRAVDFALRGVEKVQHNITDPEAPLRPLPIDPPVPYPRSVQEGRARSEALGHQRETLDYLRKAADQTRDPEIRSLVYDLIELHLRAQAEIGKPDGSYNRVLENLPTRDYSQLNPVGNIYKKALDQLTSSSRRQLAQAILLLAQTRELTTLEKYRNLTDTQMVEMGINPASIHSMGRNAFRFEKRVLLETLDRPILKDLPGTKTFRQAIEEHYGDFDKINQAMCDFLADPLAAKILRVETVRHPTLVRALKEVDRERFIDFYKDSNKLPPKDPTPAGRGKYEDALGQLIGQMSLQEMEQVLLQTTQSLSLAPEGVQQAIQAKAAYRRSRRVLSAEQQEGHRRLEPDNDQFHRSVDEFDHGSAEKPGALELNFQLQLRAIRKDLERVIASIGDSMFQGRNYVEAYLVEIAKSKDTSAEVKRYLKDPKHSILDKLSVSAEEAINHYRTVVRKERGSIDKTRAIERIEAALSHLRKFSREALKEETLPGSEARVISPRTAIIGEKMDANWSEQPIEQIKAGNAVLRPTLRTARQFAGSLKRGESRAYRDDLLLGQAADTARITDSRYISDPNTNHIVELEPTITDQHHVSHNDFLYLPILVARAVQLLGRHGHRDFPGIFGKLDLPKQMREAGVAEPIVIAVENVIEAVGSTRAEYERAITNAARAMAYDHRSWALFSELMMTLYSLFDVSGPVHPYTSTSAIMAPPKGARSLALADAVAALTGEFPMIILSTTLGAYSVNPGRPKTPLPYRYGPTTTVTDLFFYETFIDPQTDPFVKHHNPTSHSNWIRTYWHLQATTPEYRPKMKVIDEALRSHRKPGDPQIERELETRFAPYGVYPRAGIDTNQIAVIGNRLERTRDELSQMHVEKSNSPEVAALSDALARKEWLLERVRRGENLEEKDRKKWEALQRSLSDNPVHPHANQIINGLQEIIRRFTISGIPYQSQVLDFLTQKLGQVQIAFARQLMGERLYPIEALLIEDLEGSLVIRNSERPSDRLVSYLRYLTPREVEARELAILLEEEEIRTERRQRVNTLPDRGRGNFDPVTLDTQGVGDRMLAAAITQGEIPTSRWATLQMAARLLPACAALGVAALVDQATDYHFKLYDRLTNPVAKWVSAPSRSRTVIDPNGIRAIEEVYIEARRQNRPIVIAASHASMMDIVEALKHFYTGIVAKDSLRIMPGVGALIDAGPNSSIVKPKDRSAYPSEEAYQADVKKSHQQILAAGEKSIKQGAPILIYFTGARSETGLPGDPKMGAAHLAQSINGLLLVAAMNGTYEIMPRGVEFATKGIGTDGLVITKFAWFDPKTVASSNPKATLRNITNTIHTIGGKLHFETINDIRGFAQRGDSIAQLQFDGYIDRHQGGMNLVRQGRTEEAKGWAKRKRVNYELLVQLTEWWDAQQKNLNGLNGSGH